MPFGIVRKGKISILGNGVVIDPWALLKEIEDIKKQGVDVTPDNFMISESHPLYYPFIKRWMRSERMLQVKIRLELHEEYWTLL